MHDLTIGDFLEQLAARIPAPGGGAVAALHAAQAAALLAMVARYSTGPAYSEHSDVVERVLVEADALCRDALELAEDDAAAFRAVTDAYQMPSQTDDERASRSLSISEALVNAAEPPAAVIVAASHLVALAEQLLPVGNPNVASDLAAAAEAARSAATTARLNIEINLRGVRDESVLDRLVATARDADGIATRADDITAKVRELITQ